MSLPHIPVNSLLRHVDPLHSEITAAMADVVRSGYFVLGPGVTHFEQAFAEYCGVGHCVGVANGTDALEISMKAIGVVPGDRVAVTANAAMYATSAVLACGAEPAFVDIEPGYGLIDLDSLRQLMTSGVRIRAVVVTHLYGRLARMDEINDLCKPAGIAVIEDCAQAHGARLPDGRCAGALGDVSCFSFYPTKNLGALGDAGAVATHDPEIAQKARQLRQYGWDGKYSNALPGGRNSRLDEVQARVLGVMLPRLDHWNARRRQIANRYSQAIRHPDIWVPPVAGEEYVAHLYVARSARRDALREHLSTLGVCTDVHYPQPDHRQSCHQGRYDELALPVTEAEEKLVLTLPCFPELTDNEADRIIDACNRF